MSTIDLTGRDDFIINKALAYAVVCIQNLPKERRPNSDMSDMLDILRHRASPEAVAVFASSAEISTGLTGDFLEEVEPDRLGEIPSPDKFEFNNRFAEMHTTLSSATEEAGLPSNGLL
ncbi:hypothetical protein [Devosia naphthalenivorans]|uniref:hypothetical protein n=1 Tax=Devosia naphthalenivorans TaxID=2082392 RepID=UPI000D3692DC|nr:hypothetical protein [Devosia naphthalenivorans]